MANIQVTVVELRDFKLLDSGRTSDPYCILTTGGDYEKPQMTTVRKGAAGSAFFNETFTLPLLPSSKVLRIDVADKDTIGSDEQMGRVEIPLAHFQDQVVHDEWYRISLGGSMHLIVKLTDPSRPPAAPMPFEVLSGPGGMPMTTPGGMPPGAVPGMAPPPMMGGMPGAFPPPGGMPPGAMPGFFVPMPAPGYTGPGYPAAPGAQPGGYPGAPGMPMQPGMPMGMPMGMPAMAHPTGPVCKKCGGTGMKAAKPGKSKPPKKCKKCGGTGRA